MIYRIVRQNGPLAPSGGPTADEYLVLLRGCANASVLHPAAEGREQTAPHCRRVVDRIARPSEERYAVAFSETRWPSGGSE